MDFIKISFKPLLLAAAVTFFFVFLIPLHQDSWAYPLSFNLVAFVLPKWIESNQLSLLKNVLLTLFLVAFGILLICFFCPYESIKRYLISFLSLYCVVIFSYLFKGAYTRRLPPG